MHTGGERDRAAFAELEVADGRARAVVRRTHAEDLCAGHFPGDPLVPGAYLAGLMSDVAAALVDAVQPSATLAGIEDCGFSRRVVPHEVITIEARLAERRGATIRVDAEVRCAGVRAARARLRFGGAA